MTRRKFTSKFKTKVVLEALKERESLLSMKRAGGLESMIKQMKLDAVVYKAKSSNTFLIKLKIELNPDNYREQRFIEIENMQHTK